jgi:hypothetical protein
MYGPAVRRKRNCRSVGFAVLHQCIRPQIGAFAPGHHGYQRACVLITGQASSGAIRFTRVRMRREDRPPSRLILSQTSTRVIGLCHHVLLVGVVPLFVPLAVPSSRPAYPCGASRAGAVKAGRRVGLAAGINVSRPRLDGPEHGAMLTQPGTRAPLRLRRRLPC